MPLTELLPNRAPAQPRERTASTTLPPLESGDRLTRWEFERRYAAMPTVKKVELLKGVVYMGSPVRFRSHAKPHSQVLTWLGVYCAATPGVEMADNATLRLDAENEVQPDALLYLPPEGSEHICITEDDYLEGVPELIVEIAASSAAYDMHDKWRVYRRNGVQEYLVWLVYEQRLHWWQWQEGEYIPLTPDAQGIIRSHQFPGLDLAVTALLAGDLAQVLTTLQAGLASQAHTDFVAKLQR